MRVSLSFVIVAGILLVPVYSKVGTLKGNETSPESVDEKNPGSQSEASVSWWQILLIVVGCLCVLLCGLFCYFKKCQLGHGDFAPVKTEATVVCHLCLEKISWSEWDSGRHRAKCEKDNEYFLKSLSQAKNIHCPNCGDRMRQWLKMGPGFTCNEEGCHRSNFLIINTGKNRFNCFKCDTDFCGDCVNKKIQKDEAKPIYCLKHTDESHNTTLSKQMANRSESEEAINESLLASNDNKLQENDVVNNNAASDKTATSSYSSDIKHPSNENLSSSQNQVSTPTFSSINNSNPFITDLEKYSPSNHDLHSSNLSNTDPQICNPSNPDLPNSNPFITDPQNCNQSNPDLPNSNPFITDPQNCNPSNPDVRNSNPSNPSSTTLPPNIKPESPTLADKKASRASLPYNIHLNDSDTLAHPPAIPWATHPTLDSKESPPESFFA